MAKGIIVIDIPQSCEECKFSMLYECGIIYCKAIKDFVNTEKPKPDWCPIEPIKDNHKASYLNRERVIEKPKRLDYYCLS